MTHLCQPHPTNTTSGPMTEDTWGLPRVCPGAEVRQGGKKRQGGTRVGEAERSRAPRALQLCRSMAATGDSWGRMD